MFDNDAELLVICSNDVKDKILKQAFQKKRLFNITFLTPTAFKERFYFKITTEAYLYAADFLGCSYANSKIITPFIYYIDDKVFDDEKLIQLQTLKKELSKRSLLEVDPLFTSLLKRKKVYFYDDLDTFLLKMIEEVKKITTVELFKFDALFPLETVNEFVDNQQEIEYVFMEISKLLADNVDINKIFIANANKSYNHLLCRYATLFNIPVMFKEQSLIIADREVKQFIKEMQNTNVSAAIDKVKNINTKNILINLINEYYRYGDLVFISELNNRCFETEKFTDVIKVVDIDYGFDDDDIVFVVNFTNGSLPKIYLDDEYLGDKYQNILPIESSEIKNKKARNKAIYLLERIKNKRISYPLRTNEAQSPSSLIRVSNLKVCKPSIDHNFSTNLGRVKYGIKMDDYLNYGRCDIDLPSLDSTFKNEYQSYDNQFKPIEKDLLYRKLEGKINLSYSSVSEYFKCGFYFYLDRVLKIPYENDQRAADLGTAYHEILEKYHTPDFDLMELKQEKEQNFSEISDKFYFEKFWDDFLMVLKFIDAISEYTMLHQEKHENEVKLDFSDAYWEKVFKGFIDKIMFENIDGIDYIAIVDYKTGSSQSSSLDNICYGINLQLPVYMYLVYRSKLFTNPRILGSYLHYVFNEPSSYKDNLSIEEQKWNALKLVGYSIDDPQDLKLLDYAYADSKMIRGLRMNKDHKFDRYAKILSADNFTQIVTIVDKLIEEAFTAIENGEFAINPKEIDRKNVSCTYCHYQDICYKRYENKVELKHRTIEEILGGE